MKIKEIKEGEIKLSIPDPEEYESPENAPVFYNPVMEKDRTLSTEILRNFFMDKKPRVLDALSATGARAIRYEKEAGAEAVANDADPKAVKLIKENAKKNEVEVQANESDANKLLTSGEKFDCVDLDPFGSPAPFLNNAFKGLEKRKSLLAVTATDLGALSGHYPKTCFRRYGTRCQVNPFNHEIGLRNLIYSVYKFGAVNEFTVDPILCYWRKHYYRCFFEVKRSKTGINRNMNSIGYLAWCENCGRRKKVGLFEDINNGCRCGSDMNIIGPTWLDYMGEDEFIDELEFHEPFFQTLRKEMKIKELHYDTHWMASKTSDTAKKKKECIKELEEDGYRANETIFTGHGFRTNAPQERVREIFQ